MDTHMLQVQEGDIERACAVLRQAERPKVHIQALYRPYPGPIYPPSSPLSRPYIGPFQPPFSPHLAPYLGLI